MIDFSKIPVPDIVEALDFEGVFADIVADFRTRFPDFDALVESDPAIKLIEAFAYREVLLRARINNAARACMIASATGADLDNIAANFGVMRKPDENDSDLRKRTILAIEASATAGSRNAYIYHASSVEGTDDVSVTSPTPGLVHVHVLAKSSISDESALCGNVAAVLNADTVRPLTDTVEVFPAIKTEFAIAGTLVIDGSLDASLVAENARAALEAFTKSKKRLGQSISLTALSAAVFVEGVVDFKMTSPTDPITCDASRVPVCTGISLTTEISHGNAAESCTH